MLVRKMKKQLIVAFLVFVLFLLAVAKVDVCSATTACVTNNFPSVLSVASDNGMGQALHDAFQYAKPYLRAQMEQHRGLNLTAPTVSVISIAQNQTYIGNVSLDFKVSQNATYQYCLNGQENITISGNTTLTNLAVGPQTLIVYAHTAGCTGASETVNFTIAQQKTTEINVEPSPTVNWAAVGGFFVAVAVLSLIVYFKYHRETD